MLNMRLHVVGGVVLADADKLDQVTHAIMAQNGTKEHPPAVEPATIEALLLAWLDDLDSLLEPCLRALADTEVGSFTEGLEVLGGRQLYRHI